jgi:hypothetical protein
LGDAGEGTPLVVPTVSQQIYYVRVIAAGGGEVSHRYDLEIENFAAPVPSVIGIDPSSDTGTSNHDALTSDPRPPILVQADLSELLNSGIPLLAPSDPNNPGTGLPPGEGVAVEVTVTDTETGAQYSGFATALGASGQLFTYRPAAASPLPTGSYTVTAAVHIFDATSFHGAPAPATGRTIQSAPFLLTIDRVAPVAASQPDMLSASDTGRSTVDNVTRISTPAFRGVGDPNTKVRVYANRIGGEIEVVGHDVTNADGSWEITIEPLDDDIYHIRAELEDLAGNISSLGEPLLIEVDTQSPNLPYLDLLRPSDSGTDSADNVTALSSLDFSMTTQDPRQNSHWNRFNYNYRLFLRRDAGDGQAAAEEVLLYDSLQDTAIPPENVEIGLTDLEQLVRTFGPFADGVHNLKLEVEDRAGNASADFLLPIVVDTGAPLADIQLLSSSDSGPSANDAVTRHDQPAFGGRTDVGTVVNLYANGRMVGRGQAGNDASDGELGDGLGSWEVTSEPLSDGEYEITAQFVDLAGNDAQSEPSTVTIDTAAPNLPYLDLITDSGISDTDNITATNPPVFTITASDRIEGGPNPFPNDIAYRLYDRNGAGEEVLLINSFIDPGGLSEQGFFTFTPTALSEGVHNLKLEVEDRAGNVSLPFTLSVEIDTEGPTVVNIDLADYSDSGASDTDNVTRIAQPAVLGVGTIGDTVRITANGELVGRGVVNGDLSDGVPDDGLGAWEVTLEPLDDGVYDLVATIENVAGNVATSSTLAIEVDTLEPNTPLLDLVEGDDHGRHNDDNITNAENVVLSATTHDPNGDNHLQLTPGGQNVRYRIYRRSEQATEVLIYDSATDASVPDQLDGLTAALQILTTPLVLPEAWNNLKLEVEDRAGNLSHDYLLDMLADRAAYGGQAMLHPNSDSGVLGLPETFIDGITNVRTPWLTGTAEANSLVMVTIDGVAAGTAVAIPLDGDDAVQPPNAPYTLQGNWQLQLAVGLSDGPHEVVATFEDPAGNRAVDELTLTIDTAGPKIINVTRNEPEFPSLFDPKPTSGPDPLINSIVIHLSEGAIAETIAVEEGNYQLTGDASGNIPIVSVELVTIDATNSQLILNFNDPLPDDRYSLKVSDAISDLVGNHLDGESGAEGPFEGQPGLSPTEPIFPTGDGVPGGQFEARFTVDSRPEIGTWAAGSVWVDINGNLSFDPENSDTVNRDIVFRYGFTSDDIFAGNFALPGQSTDGYDKLAAYGRAEGQFRWLVDTDNDGVPNIDRVEPQAANGLPVAGRFDVSAANGDEVGIFDGTFWYFDTNHDFLTDTRLRSHLVGYPIVGDFDGDGFDDLGTWADDRFMIDLAAGALRGWDGAADEIFTFGFIGVRERPVAADMNQDGFDDFGLWVPDREGVTDRDQSEWYFLISDGESLIERFSPPDDPVDSRPVIDFTPRPFGSDMFARFGDEFALPIVGNFDPPTLPLERRGQLAWTNQDNVLDVNDDDAVSPLDALLVLNELNQSGARELAARGSAKSYLDVNTDGFVSPVDALLVLNELNRINFVSTLSRPVAARPSSLVASALLADEAFADLSLLDQEQLGIGRRSRNFIE